MAPLGTTSLSRLVGVKSQTRDRAIMLAEYATQIGGDVGIAEYGGFRDAATQAQLVKWRDDSVAAGGPFYAVAPPGHSAHETGDAFDLQWNDAPDGWTMAQFQKELADYAPELGLRAGYYFHGGPPNKGADPNHFENATIEPDTGVEGVTPAEPSGSASSTLVAGLAVLLGVLLLMKFRR